MNDQIAALGTGGSPDRELANPPPSPREQQVREIDAGHEQHQCNRAEHDLQRQLRTARDLVRHRHEHRAELRALRRTRRKIGLDGVELRRRLCLRHALAQTADGNVVVRADQAQIVRPRCERREEFGSAQIDVDAVQLGELRKIGSCRQHANHHMPR